LAVLHSDAHDLYDGLVHGDGLAALIVSIVAGVAALYLVWRRSYEPARYSASLAVAAIIAGWALAQNPTFLPGLTVKQAAAPHDTSVAVVVAVIVGGAILFPSLALLFRLVVAGRLDYGEPPPSETVPIKSILSASAPGFLARSAAACFVAGVGFLTVADADWAHGIGVAALLAFIVLGFFAVAPAEIAREEV